VTHHVDISPIIGSLRSAGRDLQEFYVGREAQLLTRRAGLYDKRTGLVVNVMPSADWEHPPLRDGLAPAPDVGAGPVPQQRPRDAVVLAVQLGAADWAEVRAD
jgi:hypothetical protein